MPSKATTVALMMGLSLCRALCGAMPGEVFAANRADILSEGTCAVGGYRFSCAVEEVSSEDGDEREVAKQAAAFWASTGLVWGAMTERLEWPKELAPEHRRVLANALPALFPVSANVRGLTLVYEAFDGERWTAVAALPEEQLEALPRITFESARDRLLVPELIYAPDAPIEALAALRALEEPLPAPVDRTPWAALLAKAVFETPRLSALPRLAGRYPIGTAGVPTDEDWTQGFEAYRQGDLQAAYKRFLASAERAYTFDALNMAGNVARRLGKLPEAVALLVHAAYLKPDVPYPWVHLAFVAKAEGNAALAERCCARALERGPEDAWVVEQVAALRAPQKPQPPPEAAAPQKPATLQKPAAPTPAKKPAFMDAFKASVAPTPVKPESAPAAPVQQQPTVPAATPAPDEPKVIIQRADTPPDVY